MIVQNNTPSAGYISWSGCTIEYRSVTYSIADGSSNKKYIWWDFTTPTVFQESDTLPTMDDADVIVFYNENGTYHLESIRSQMHGDMLLDDTVGPGKLTEEYVGTTGNETVAGVKTFSEIPFGPSEDPTEDDQLVRKAYADGLGGVSDHGALTGLGDDDHLQYVLRNILTTTGDIFIRASDGTVSKLALGSDGQILVVDTTQDPPLKYAAAGAPGAHTLGGASHTADTLANLNTKISDATLSDTRVVILKVMAAGTALTVADGLMYFTIPIELNGMNLVSVGAHVYTVSSSGLPTVQIHNLTDTVDMLSTRITIDANEKDSKDAAAPAVINAANDDVATGDEIRIDCDVAGTGTKGLEVRLGFKLP